MNFFVVSHHFSFSQNRLSCYLPTIELLRFLVFVLKIFSPSPLSFFLLE
jgi:hypothetical protein